MAESVDALVSNTSGATRAGSTPPGPNPFLFLVRHSEQGGPPGPLSLAYSLRPNTLEIARELAKVSHTHPRESTL